MELVDKYIYEGEMSPEEIQKTKEIIREKTDKNSRNSSKGE
jgi:hypothetical protein